jgi:mannitol/fructose-specific phosphotransferase system IIA component
MTDITALRQHLFAAIAGVRDGSIELDKARAINEIGKTLIDSGRVEVEYLKTTGGGESSFLDTAIGAANLPDGITGVVRHLIKG